MPQLVDFSKDLQGLLVIGYFFDDIVEVGLSVNVAAHFIPTFADELLIIELIEGIEVKGFDRFACTFHPLF